MLSSSEVPVAEVVPMAEIVPAPQMAMVPAPQMMLSPAVEPSTATHISPVSMPPQGSAKSKWLGAKKARVSVVLDRDTYWAGETVTGMVYFEAGPKEVEAHSLEISLVGEEKTSIYFIEHWVHPRTNVPSNAPHRAKSVCNIVRCSDKIATFDGKTVNGQYQFRFSIALPKGLPSVYRSAQTEHAASPTTLPSRSPFFLSLLSHCRDVTMRLDRPDLLTSPQTMYASPVPPSNMTQTVYVGRYEYAIGGADNAGKKPSGVSNWCQVRYRVQAALKSWDPKKKKSVLSQKCKAAAEVQVCTPPTEPVKVPIYVEPEMKKVLVEACCKDSDTIGTVSYTHLTLPTKA